MRTGHSKLQPDLEIPKQGINDSADAEVHRLNFSCIPQTVCGSPPCSTRSSSRGVLHSTHKQDPSSLRLLASSAQDPRKLHRANHPPSLELTWAPRLQTSQPLRTRARAPRPGERGDPGSAETWEPRGPGSAEARGARSTGSCGRLRAGAAAPRPGTGTGREGTGGRARSPWLAARRGGGGASAGARGGVGALAAGSRDVGRRGARKVAASRPKGRSGPEREPRTTAQGPESRRESSLLGDKPGNSKLQLDHGSHEPKPVALSFKSPRPLAPILQPEAKPGRGGETC